MADSPAVPAAPPAPKKVAGKILTLNPSLAALAVTRHEASTPLGTFVFTPGAAIEVPTEVAPAVEAFRVTLADPPVPAVVPYVAVDTTTN